jgi:hypothetical protein
VLISTADWASSVSVGVGDWPVKVMSASWPASKPKVSSAKEQPGWGSLALVPVGPGPGPAALVCALAGFLVALLTAVRARPVAGGAVGVASSVRLAGGAGVW